MTRPAITSLRALLHLASSALGQPAALPAPFRERAGEGLRQLVIVLATTILTIGLADHPFRMVLIAVLCAYTLLLIKVPRAPLVLLPMLLPVLDFAPLTGRFFLDEYDLLLLVTLIAANCRTTHRVDAVRTPVVASALFWLFALSTMVAAGQGMWPLQWPDINAFNNYYSHFNGLRVAKGVLWCALLVPALRRELHIDAAGTYRRFGLGMTLGVAAAAAAVLWERAVFTGLFNFGSGYRVTGAFSAMHIGGAYIEGYFVLGLPFVAWGALVHRHGLWRLFCLGLFLLGSYCMMVTYARGGYVALLTAIMALVAAIPFMKWVVIKPMQIVVMALLFVVMAGVALPVLTGGVMKGRFATTQTDLQARAAHWRQALRMMDGSLQTSLFGMGSGRYPALSFWAAGHTARPAAYRLRIDPHNRFLQLTPGLPLYFEQVVAVQPKRRYRISFSARSTDDGAMLSLPVCEKWLLYSATCFTDTVRIGDTQGRWKKFAIAVDTTELEARPWHAARPLKLALHNVGASALDIDNVSMTTDGHELIRNGDFEQQMDHWFFSVDDFVAWHFENTWLQLYFEQGAVGLLLFVSLIICMTIISTTRLGEKDFPLPPLGAALFGFLALGTLDSLFDFPRLSLLFFTILLFMIQKPQSSAALAKH